MNAVILMDLLFLAPSTWNCVNSIKHTLRLKGNKKGMKAAYIRKDKT